jgi:hypothetical protein
MESKHKGITSEDLTEERQFSSYFDVAISTTFPGVSIQFVRLPLLFDLRASNSKLGGTD